MEFQAEVIGVEEVVQTFRELGGRVERDKTIRSSLRKAGRYLVKKGKANLRASRIKKVTGNLMKSFVTKVKRRNRGVLAGFSKKGSHSHLIDKGTAERQTAKGYNRGKVTGNLFWTDVRYGDTKAAQAIIMGGITQAINKMRNNV